MFYEAEEAQCFAQEAMKKGVYVTAVFFFPVVPRDRARIRTRMSAALSELEIENVPCSFEKAKARM